MRPSAGKDLRIMADQIKNAWLWLSTTDLRTELAQLCEEGRDVGRLKAKFDALIALGDDKLFSPRNQRRAEDLLDDAQKLPVVKDYPFREPSTLAGIRALRPSGPRRVAAGLPDAVVRDRIHGAWLGRCIGCLLGRPLEGVRTDEIWPFLKQTEQWPLSGYVDVSALKGRTAKKFPHLTERLQYHAIGYMPIDDDTNYTTTGFAIVSQHGADFTSCDVARFWTGNIPMLATCTAERIAYRNFGLHIQPPASAVARNPYREWIGAQIRADAFGYVTIGNPERAAEFAWRDASISHIKNGIYGEMFAAAMISSAPYCDGAEEIVRAGLSEIPRTSRLSRDIGEVLSWFDEGIDYDTAAARVHRRWDEHKWHDWTHTNSNAAVCAMALLWGENDFGTSVCRAVQPGFDTDCNGATVGSVFGAWQGARAIPSVWTKGVNDTLHTSLQGYEKVKISGMAEKTFEIYRKMRRAG